jgi:hypothetical protein
LTTLDGSEEEDHQEKKLDREKRAVVYKTTSGIKITALHMTVLALKNNVRPQQGRAREIPQ